MDRHPERTCVGCRSKSSKRTLLRFVRTSGGAVTLDPGGSAPGRGAYIHPDAACAEPALERGALARALRTSLSPKEAGRLMAEIESKVRAG